MANEKFIDRFRQGQPIRAEDMRELARLASRPIYGPGVFDTAEGTYIRDLSPASVTPIRQVYVKVT